MLADPPRRPPYVDWSLDRWKIGTVLALFLGLLAASLATPVPPDVATTVAASGLVNPRVPPPVSAPRLSGPDISGPDVSALNAAPVIVPESLQPEPQLPIPLTLATLGPNSILPSNSVRVLSGTASPRAQVEVRTQIVGRALAENPLPSAGAVTVLGTTHADDDGLWQVVLDRPLQPGQHVLSLREMDERGQLRTVGDPIVVSVLAPGEQGPLALAIPMIRTPATGARLPAGPISITGVGLPGLVVRLYVNDEQVASGMVSAQDSWAMSPDDALGPGVYVARVLALNPQGEVLAESAPVVFVVESDAERSSVPYSLPNPSLPLTVSGLAFSDRRRTTLIVRGLATPHVAVAAWLDGQPMQQTNATVEGNWLVMLDNPAGFGARDVVQIRSSLGEQVRTDLTRQPPLVQMVDSAPRLTSPQAGAVLTSPQPLLTGTAQPGALVAILINEQVVAEVTADAQGQWAFQLNESLPTGIVAMAVGPGRQPRPARLAAPVVVTIAPEL